MLWGDADDPPLQRVGAELDRRGVDTIWIDSQLDIDYELAIEPNPSGWLSSAGVQVAIASIGGCYLRPAPPPQDRVAAGAALSALVSCLPVPVVNRPSAGRSNASKPLQLRLLARAGFEVPETLVTTTPSAVAEFSARHGRVVYKSISGVRSIVALLDPANVQRLELVRNGPVQFQRWIPGKDVRVHVVGERWFATVVVSGAVDYRYPTGPDEVEMAPVDIPVALGRRLVEFVRSQGLLVAGADLRLTPDGRWFALEVNPSPGFSFYQDATGQPIAGAIADLLTRPERLERIADIRDACRPAHSLDRDE